MYPRNFLKPSARLCALLAVAGPWWAPVRAADEQPLIIQQPPIVVRPAPIIINGAQIRVQRQVGANGIAFFGNNDDDTGDGESAGSAAPDAAGPHLLEFADGSHLHGTLATLETAPGQLGWQRTDASAPLTFPLGIIGRLTLPADANAGTKVHATVKLTGGDWLAADVTGLTDKKVQLKLGDGSPLTIDREKVEWIYFSKNAAAECYDGPTSLAGWVTDGGWTFRDGALRAAMPAAIGRSFEALPDQTEYFLEVDQGAVGHAFTLTLHSNGVISRGRGTGTIQLMFRGSDLNLWMQNAQGMVSEQIELSKLLPGLDGDGAADKKPVQLRVFEDYPGGRLLLFVNGRKIAERTIKKGEEGENRGSVSFQPQGWNPDSEQVISQFRVIPWDGRVPKDGAPDEAAAKTDLVSLGGDEARAGGIESLNGEHLKLHTDGGTVEVSRAKIVMLRFHRTAHPADEDPPVAHVQLAQRGAFDVAGLTFRHGRFTMRTNFGGELTLPAAALCGIDFARAPWSSPKPADELVFHNGDRLRGALERADGGRKLRWQCAQAEAPVEFDTADLAGIAFAAPADPPEAKIGLVARLHNGDTLGGALVKCDAANLVLDSAPAGQFAIARDRVQALYFSADGKPPVLDGAARRDTWAGLENDPNGQYVQAGKKKADAAKARQPSAWRSFDGVFAYSPLDTGRAKSARMGSLRLVTDFTAMPEVVELAFDMAVPKSQAAFSAQLFFDDNNPGYLLQVYPQGLYVYDMGARQQLRGAGPQQIQFGDKVKPKSRQRHLRVLANRRTGKLTLMVDGAVVGQIGPKAGSPPRNLGRNVTLTNSAAGPCTFANLWIGPWDGRPPDLAPVPDAPPHTVLLANGDETHGTVGEITAEAAKIDSEAGLVELPTSRVVAIDFGGPPPAPRAGTRIRFAEWGALTVKSYRLEKDEIVCQSDLAGELKLPRSSVREIVFPDAAPKSGTDKKSGP